MTRYVETISDATASTCLGCGVDVHLPEPVHTLACPTVTDVWPTTEREISEEFSCTRCDHLFELGELYHGADVVCLGCGALEVGERDG